MKEIPKSLIVLFILSSGISPVSAKVYSTIHKIEALEGYEDCFKITYKLWEDHNNTDPSDDTYISTHSAIVGSDCISPGFVQDESVGPVISPNSGTVLSFAVSPNPARDLLMIEVDHLGQEVREVYWMISEASRQVVNTGRSWIEGSASFTINTNDLDPGLYVLTLSDGRSRMGSITFTILNH